MGELCITPPNVKRVIASRSGSYTQTSCCAPAMTIINKRFESGDNHSEL